MPVSATTVTQYYTGIFRQAPSDAVSLAYQAMANDSAALNSMLSAANLQVDPVVRMYQTAFNRVPDNAGMTAWVVPYSTGAITLQAIANGFTQSTEFTTLYPTTMSNAQFVGALYWNILNRQGEDAGIAGWVNALNTGALTRAQVLLGFSESAEYKVKVEPNVNTFLTNCATNTQTYTGSLFDQGGSGTATTYTLTTNIDTINATGEASISGIIDFGGGTTPGSATTMNAGDKITGSASVNDRLNITMQNANGTALGTATAAVAQVVTVTAPLPAAATDTVTFIYNGQTATYITGAAAADSAAAFTAALNALVGKTIAVQTAGTGTVVVTAATAGVPFALSFSTATAAGDLPSAALTTANVPASGGAISFGDTSGVEILNLRNASGSAATVAAATMNGVIELNSDRSTNDLAFTGLTSSMKFGIKGDGTSTQLGALSGTYGDTVTTGTVTIAGGAKAGALTVTGAGMTTVNINSVGGAQSSTAGQVNTFASTTAPATAQTINITAATSLTTGAIAGAALTTINASGAATTVNVGTLVNNVTTVNGSGLTAGGITATLGTGILTFTGGAGTDTITTAATTAAGAVINAGAGTGDILVLAAGNDVTTSAKAGQYQNFEILRNGTAGAVDASLFAGITSVQTSATGAGFTNLTAGQATNITVRATNANATFALTNSTGTSDVIGFTLNSSTNSITASSLTGVTVNGFETMNVVSSSGTNGAVNALSFTGAANLTALNISGTAPISVTTTNIALAAAINASAMTFVPSAGNYTFTITGNLVKGSAVTGTGAADSITTTGAVTGTSGEYVTYNAGAGNDAISSTAAAINNTSAANASVKIDGGTGTDTLTLTDGAGLTMVDNNFQYLTNIEKITYAELNQAISITSGGFFNTNFAGGVTLTLGEATNAQANTVNLSTFTGNATVSLTATAANTNASAITTGSGTDTVTLLAAGTTTAAHTISTGAGNDTVNVTISGTTITSGSVTINTGLGQDSITVTGNSLVNANTAPNIIVTVNEGTSTTTAWDVVNGWVLNDTTKAAGKLDFDGTGTVMADVGATASVIANVTYAVTAGIMTFGGSGAAGLTLAQKVQIAQAADIVADKTVAFLNGADTFVFHNGAAAADAGDSLIQLVGVTALGLGTAVNSGNGYVMIG